MSKIARRKPTLVVALEQPEPEITFLHIALLPWFTTMRLWLSMF